VSYLASYFKSRVKPLANSRGKSRVKSRATPWLGARTIHAPIRRPATRDQRPPGTLKVRSRCIASVSIFMRSRKSRSRCLMPAIVPGSFSRQTRRDQPGVFIRGLSASGRRTPTFSRPRRRYYDSHHGDSPRFAVEACGVAFRSLVNALA